MSVLTFELTSEMDQYADDIKAFVELMVFKLHKNIHKGRWENMTAVQAYFLLQEECTELEQALRSNDWDNTYL
jgi:NTP pyrophosphatase (non-canonical NTP hydrolase)